MIYLRKANIGLLLYILLVEHWEKCFADCYCAVPDEQNMNAAAKPGADRGLTSSGQQFVHNSLNNCKWV